MSIRLLRKTRRPSMSYNHYFKYARKSFQRCLYRLDAFILSPCQP